MELLEQIVRAGVVGLGGAGFPTGKKLDCRVEWLIVNGAECEPLLRTDRYLMRHNAGRVVRAAGAVARMVGAKHCVIALKRAYTEEWKALEAALVGELPGERRRLSARNRPHRTLPLRQLLPRRRRAGSGVRGDGAGGSARRNPPGCGGGGVQPGYHERHQRRHGWNSIDEEIHHRNR